MSLEHVGRIVYALEALCDAADQGHIHETLIPQKFVENLETKWRLFNTFREDLSVKLTSIILVWKLFHAKW